MMKDFVVGEPGALLLGPQGSGKNKIIDRFLQVGVAVGMAVGVSVW